MKIAPTVASTVVKLIVQVLGPLAVMTPVFVQFEDHPPKLTPVCAGAVNVTETEMLKKPVSEIGLGTYGNLQTASMDTPVIDVIHMMVKKSISSVPIVDEDYRVLNVFEAVMLLPSSMVVYMMSSHQVLEKLYPNEHRTLLAFTLVAWRTD